MSDDETIAEILADCINLIEAIAGEPLPPEEIARRLADVLREASGPEGRVQPPGACTD